MPDLLPDVKRYLKITWDSDDDMLSGIIKRGGVAPVRNCRRGSQFSGG